MAYSESSNTPYQDGEKTFLVTHPFHPLSGNRFVLMNCAQAWGEDRVYYINDEGQIDNMPTQWTDIAPLDPFVTIGAGRAALRTAELVEMVRLIGELSPDCKKLATKRKGKNAAIVKTISPQAPKAHKAKR
jgi:hypothetical protein